MKLLSTFCLLLTLVYYCDCSLTWQDCGTPLTRVLYYETVTLSPSSNIPSVASSPLNPPKLSININFRLVKPLPDGNANTLLQVIKDGVQYLTVDIKDLCTILLATGNLFCSNLKVGQIYSVSYNWEVPPMPTGNYTARLVSFDNSGTIIGCASATTSVKGLSDTKCAFTSTFDARINADNVQFQYDQVSKRTVGSWIQLGPWGSNAQGKNIPWGIVKSFQGTADVLDGQSNTANYTWGINGTLTKITAVGSTTQHQYDGNFIVGYERSPLTYDYVSSGYFTFTFSYTTANIDTSPQQFVSGTFTVNQKYSFPYGFNYPIILGNLNPFSVAPDTELLDLLVHGDTEWCNCGYDACGVCGGDGSVCGEAVVAGSSGLSEVDKGAIVVAVVGFAAFVVVLIFGVKHIRAADRKIPKYDDSDLMYPQKPDYGSIALNEVLEDDQNLI